MKEFKVEDVIPLNPTPEQLEPLKLRLKERKAAAKQAKKEAKKTAPKEEQEAASGNHKKRKEPTAGPETSSGTPALGLDVQAALKKALQTHESMAQKSAVYRSMFGPEKRAKITESPEETFMIAGTHRAYI